MTHEIFEFRLILLIGLLGFLLFATLIEAQIELTRLQFHPIVADGTSTGQQRKNR